MDGTFREPVHSVSVEGPLLWILQTAPGEDLGVEPVELPAGQKRLQRFHLLKGQPGFVGTPACAES